MDGAPVSGWLDILPLIDTSLIVISGVCVVAGYTFIRRGRRRLHMWSMITASVFAALFLIVYVLKSALIGPTLFEGHGEARVFYLSLLAVHTLFATVLPIFVLFALYNAWRQRFSRHKRIGRVTVPMWIFVAASGWVIYYMLYHVRWSA